MQIRTARAEDAAQVCELWEVNFGYTEARNAPRKVFARALSWDHESLLVAVEGDRIVGTLIVGYDGHRGWLYRCTVAPSERGRGAARLLVTSGEARLQSLGCTKVNLQLHTSNEDGRKFWAALGYGEEARISMGKDLTGSATPGSDAGC